jgi:hypothetical protein
LAVERPEPAEPRVRQEIASTGGLRRQDRRGLRFPPVAYDPHVCLTIPAALRQGVIEGCPCVKLALGPDAASVPVSAMSSSLPLVDLGQAPSTGTSVAMFELFAAATGTWIVASGGRQGLFERHIPRVDARHDVGGRPVGA